MESRLQFKAIKVTGKLFLTLLSFFAFLLCTRILQKEVRIGCAKQQKAPLLRGLAFVLR